MAKISQYTADTELTTNDYVPVVQASGPTTLRTTLATLIAFLFANMPTSAITLGYAERTSNFTTTTGGSFVNVTDLSVTVTVPAGGRRIKITGYAPFLGSTQVAGLGIDLAVQEDATLLTMASFTTPVVGYGSHMVAISTFVPSAGSHTYKITAKQVTNGKTLTIAAAATSIAFILVELI
jgi:hypothetical protein